MEAKDKENSKFKTNISDYIKYVKPVSFTVEA